LEHEDNEVHVPESLQQEAVEPLKKMLELAK
jgi:quinolinate synthase